jgi:hypothetical protein
LMFNLLFAYPATWVEIFKPLLPNLFPGLYFFPINQLSIIDNQLDSSSNAKGLEKHNSQPFSLVFLPPRLQFPFDQSNAQGDKSKSLTFNNFFYPLQPNNLNLARFRTRPLFSTNSRNSALIGEPLFTYPPQEILMIELLFSTYLYPFLQAPMKKNQWRTLI